MFPLPHRRALLAVAGLLSCFSNLPAAEPPQVCADQSALGVPEWLRNLTIYEINVRQYSDAGTFSAVETDLPRLKELGFGALWFMPIHPIGEQNKKGSLGSPYAVRDYSTVNPAFGTEADFKRLVDKAHSLGLRVILDWVGNHSAWDNPLTQQHPEFYVKDSKGSFVPPTGFDWTDVIQFDFKDRALWDYQFEMMRRWVRDFGVDGFRCDFATGVPTAFWENVAARLRQVRPDLFLLAESELPQHQLRAFNASYGFEMMHTINAVAQARSGASRIDDTLAATRVRFPQGSALLYYTSNHDENSWQGTEFERLGAGASAFAVLAYALDGLPLVYNGQEIGLNRRLEFFEKDPIRWTADHPLLAFYRRLNELKRSHPALRTGVPMRRITTTENGAVYALLRDAGDQQLLCLLNLTAKAVTADVWDPALKAQWRDVFSGETQTYSTSATISLGPWQYRVLTR